MTTRHPSQTRPPFIAYVPPGQVTDTPTVQGGSPWGRRRLSTAQGTGGSRPLESGPHPRILSVALRSGTETPMEALPWVQTPGEDGRTPEPSTNLRVNKVDILP